MRIHKAIPIAVLCLFLPAGGASAANINTIMISNEGDGFLIDNLVAAGHGSDTLFSVLEFLQPFSGGAIPAEFVAGLPPDTEARDPSVFLAHFTGLNNPVGVNGDGSLLIAGIYGRDYFGLPGYTTVTTAVAGVGLVRFTYANDPAHYIDTGMPVDAGGSGQYTATAVVWATPDNGVPEPSSLLLVIGLVGLLVGRRRPGMLILLCLVMLAGSAPAATLETIVLTNENGLIDNLGYGNANPYQTVVALAPASFGVISEAVLDTCAALAPGAPDASNAVPEPSSVLLVAAGLAGVALLRRSGRVLPALVFLALLARPAPAALLTAETIMLSNEGDGYLIDRLIAAGHGSKNLFSVLQLLEPYSGGAIAPSFLTTMAANPPGSEIFIYGLFNFSGVFNNPIGISGDGTLIVAQVFGREYEGRAGYTTLSRQVAGVGTVKFTYANDPSFDIYAGALTSGVDTTTYKATAILWAVPDTSNGVPEPSSLLLVAAGLGVVLRRRWSVLVALLCLLALAGPAPAANIDVNAIVLSNEGDGFLIDRLIAAGHGSDNLFSVLQFLQPYSGGAISAAVMSALAGAPRR